MKKRTKSIRKKPIPKSIAHKLRCVRAVLAGASAVKVARKFGDSPRAVAYWVTRFKARGNSGLEIVQRSGRPSKLTPANLIKIRKFISDAKKNGERVTGGALSTFIDKSLGIQFTRQHCCRIIARNQLCLSLKV